MRHAAVYDEDELADDGAELNLGMGTLVGIFFGLALVCGVFFGFGYMMGHRTPGAYVSSEPLFEKPKPPQESIAPKPSALVADQPADASRVVLPTTAQASAAITPPPQAQQSIAPPAPAPPTSASAPADAPNKQPAQKSVPKVATPPPSIPTAAPAATSAAPAIEPAEASTNAGGAIMVQIAAVKNRPDAEALANAVRKDGFSPTIRTEPQDKLFHVQVGPFNNRDDAKAMRSKLSGAGYDAFIK